MLLRRLFVTTVEIICKKGKRMKTLGEYCYYKKLVGNVALMRLQKKEFTVKEFKAMFLTLEKEIGIVVETPIYGGDGYGIGGGWHFARWNDRVLRFLRSGKALSLVELDRPRHKIAFKLNPVSQKDQDILKEQFDIAVISQARVAKLLEERGDN